jgi:hypothetical protein
MPVLNTSSNCAGRADLFARDAGMNNIGIVPGDYIFAENASSSIRSLLAPYCKTAKSL